MKIHLLLVLSVLLTSCIENQTQRKVKSNEAASPGSPLSQDSQVFSLKRVGHRCELILDNEIKDIFLRTKLDQDKLRLVFKDYQEDGSLALGLASIGNFKVGSVQLQKAPDSDKSVRWVGETVLDSSRLIIRLNADPLESSSPLTGSIELVNVEETEQFGFIRNSPQTIATIENCEFIEALQVGVK